MLLPPRVPAAAVAWAVDRLATVDYTVANRVTEDVARAVHFVYDHHLPRALVPLLVHGLRAFDEVGGALIALVVWLSEHST